MSPVLSVTYLSGSSRFASSVEFWRSAPKRRPVSWYLVGFASSGEFGALRRNVAQFAGVGWVRELCGVLALSAETLPGFLVSDLRGFVVTLGLDGVDLVKP